MNDPDNLSGGRHFGFELAYQANGNVLSQRWRQSMNLRSSALQYNYAYNAVDFLTSATFSGGGYSSSAYDVTELAYDLDGNFTRISRNNQTGVGLRSHLNLSYSAGTNKISQMIDPNPIDIYNFGYDAAGNINLASHLSLSGASYDERNLPVEFNYQVNKRLDMGYDAAALRIYKADQLGNTTHFVRDVNGSVLASYYNGALRYHGLLGPDGSLFGQADGTSRYYFLKDHLGSVRTTVDFNNTALGYDDYYPFGKIMPGRSSSSSTPDDDYKFTGHQRDAELDLDYMLARNYDPLIGRFMQVDPHYFNYSDISPYIYVGNNPLSFIDPTGRDWYDINGSIVWFDQSGTLEIEFDGKMETYESLGKNVLVSYHNRDSDGNEEINTAIHMLYLESNTFNASARIEGNTIPANILTMNTLAEGIYPAREQARSRYNGERALIINNGLNVSNTKGGTMNEIFFHRGNTGRPSLITGQGINISEGCIVGPSCSGSLPRFNAFMQYLKEYNGNLYLRSNRVKR